MRADNNEENIKQELDDPLSIQTRADNIEENIKQELEDPLSSK